MAFMSSMGDAWGDDVTKQTQNSFSNIARGRLAFDI